MAIVHGNPPCQRVGAFLGGGALVATGSTDSTILVYRCATFHPLMVPRCLNLSPRLGPETAYKVVHKLEGHRLKVAGEPASPASPACRFAA